VRASPGSSEKFAGWLVENELTDAQTDRRIAQLLEKLREDRLHVAFVAEFSRGKSELINAIFFAGYGNRILPSTAGRTTMCPTELMFDRTKVAVDRVAADREPRIQRQHQRVQALSRGMGTRADRHQLGRGHAGRLRHVSDVIRVDPATAEKLGFAIADGDSRACFAST
jgi:predicted GTPase